LMAEDGTANYDFVAVQAPKYAERYWESIPKVDRGAVKVRRFDYFGHSDRDAFFLQYGLSNAKGELPRGECSIATDQFLDAARGKDVFSPSARAQLWGCHLGLEMASALTSEIPLVCAAEEATTYEDILDLSEPMPRPAKGGWKVYP
jgi:hypothetical protein